MKQPISSIDDYIQSFPPEIQSHLNRIREIIRQKAPQSAESINYGMPAYKLMGKPLIYFAGYEKHIGLYATPAGHEAFASELSAYKQGKGSVQFPIKQPIPFDLISRIVDYRIQHIIEGDGSEKRVVENENGCK